MRVAFVQGGPGLEAVEAQVARLRRLSPDRYQIEENPTGSARQRMIELFDSLRPGDELCLAALDPLRLDVGETARLLLEIVDRGARLRVAEAARVLGLTPHASDDAVRHARRQRLSEFHPDRVRARGLPRDYETLYTDRASRINRAYDQIVKERQLLAS